jgi:hypothetical protein
MDQQTMSPRQRQAMTEALMAQAAQGSQLAGSLQQARSVEALFTHDVLDRVLGRSDSLDGKAIMNAAKAYAAAKLLEQETASLFLQALQNSRPATVPDGNARRIAEARREGAIGMIRQIIDPSMTDKVIDLICKINIEMQATLLLEATDCGVGTAKREL